MFDPNAKGGGGRGPRGRLCTAIWDTTAEFSANTSILGISNAGKARSKLFRFIWTVVFLVGLGMTIYGVVEVLGDYFDNPYTSNIIPDHKVSTDFPAVTICNQNRISCRKLLQETLKEVSHNTEDGDILLELYVLTQCGLDTLRCSKVYMLYNEVLNGSAVPEKLRAEDGCLGCSMILENCRMKKCMLGGEEDPEHDFTGMMWEKMNCSEEFPNDTCSCPPVGAPAGDEGEGGDEQEDKTLAERRAEAENNTESTEDGTTRNGAENGTTSDGTQNGTVTNGTGDFIANDGLDDDGTTRNGTENGTAITGTEGGTMTTGPEKGTPGNDAENGTASNRTDAGLDNDGNVFGLDSGTLGGQPGRRKRSPADGTFLPDGMGPDGSDLHDPGKRLNMTTSSEYDRKMEFLALYMRLPRALKLKIGYAVDELVLSCEFLGKSCSNLREFFVPYMSSTYGNCFTFNRETNFSTGMTGTQSGLSLVINVDQDSYLPRLLTDSVGARVAVHAPTVPPLLNDLAYDVAPAADASLAISQTKWLRLAKPYESNCTDGWEDTNYNFREENKTMDYTYSMCIRVCMQRVIVESCNCCHPYYPSQFSYKGDQYECIDIDPCNLTSASSSSLCVKNVTDSFSGSAIFCDCPLACTEIQYPVFLSTSSWPPKSSTDYVRGVLLNKPGQDVEDLLRVNVFFYTLDVYQVVETGVYDTWEDLVSGLGGALSLYMGVSVFLLSEIIEYLLLLVYNCCRTVNGTYEGRSREVVQYPPPPPYYSVPKVSPVGFKGSAAVPAKVVD